MLWYYDLTPMPFPRSAFNISTPVVLVMSSILLPHDTAIAPVPTNPGGQVVLSFLDASRLSIDVCGCLCVGGWVCVWRGGGVSNLQFTLYTRFQLWVSPRGTGIKVGLRSPMQRRSGIQEQEKEVQAKTGLSQDLSQFLPNRGSRLCFPPSLPRHSPLCMGTVSTSADANMKTRKF